MLSQNSTTKKYRKPCRKPKVILSIEGLKLMDGTICLTEGAVDVIIVREEENDGVGGDGKSASTTLLKGKTP